MVKNLPAPSLDAIQSLIEAQIVYLSQFVQFKERDELYSFWDKAHSDQSYIESRVFRFKNANFYPQTEAWHNSAHDLWVLTMIHSEDSRYGRPTYQNEATNVSNWNAKLLVSLQDGIPERDAV